MNDKHVGSDFDDFLREEGLLEEVEAVAANRVVAFAEQRSPEGAGAAESAIGPPMATTDSVVLDR